MKQPLTVLGFGAVAPYHRPDAPHGTSDTPGVPSPGASALAELPKLDLALLERTLRRGLSDVTRLFMHAAKLALDDAGCQAAHTHGIFASAFGEIATAEALLAEAYDANGSSPARFRNSVHNTATGLLSISTHNRLACTAVAAGWETVPMALFEAAAQLAGHGENVLLVFAEERVPRALSAEHAYEPLGAAFVLTRAAAPGMRARGQLVNLRRKARSELDVALAPGAERLDLHPLASVRALVEALSVLRPRTEAPASTPQPGARVRTLALSDGENPWCVDVHAGEQS